MAKKNGLVLFSWFCLLLASRYYFVGQDLSIQWNLSGWSCSPGPPQSVELPHIGLLIPFLSLLISFLSFPSFLSCSLPFFYLYHLMFQHRVPMGKSGIPKNLSLFTGARILALFLFLAVILFWKTTCLSMSLSGGEEQSGLDFHKPLVHYQK